MDNKPQPQPQAKPQTQAMYLPVRLRLEGIFVNADENCYLDFRPPTMDDYLQMEKVFSIDGLTRKDEIGIDDPKTSMDTRIKNILAKVSMQDLKQRVDFLKNFFIGGQHKDQSGKLIPIDTNNLDQLIPYCFKHVQKLLFPREVGDVDFTKESATS